MGIIERAVLRRFVDEATQLPFTNNTPMRRLGDADGVARLVVFLARDSAQEMSPLG